MRADSLEDEVDATWVSMKVNKALTNQRYALIQLIKRGHWKPLEVTDQRWNQLRKRRSTLEAKVKSEKMAIVSKGKKCRKLPTPAEIRELAMVRLVSIFDVVGDVLRHLCKCYLQCLC